ncbi:MAG: DUF4177 domain-containing protein [Pseudomonadales bacterium]|jgi:hypothetical protein|nr:DUF4177 domain-containing protein [Pseudomonadales bacterium]|tara:strand:- start:13 stop:261 length:249 start_codon:yes stop_codon:yes gene_type:complete
MSAGMIEVGVGGNMEYKVVIYQEGMLGSLLLGGSKVDPIRFSAFLNAQAQEGWRVQTMEKDIRRMLLFFKREAYVVVMGRGE